jgi:hypothetical protein
VHNVGVHGMNEHSVGVYCVGVLVCACIGWRWARRAYRVRVPGVGVGVHGVGVHNVGVYTAWACIVLKCQGSVN